MKPLWFDNGPVVSTPQGQGRGDASPNHTNSSNMRRIDSTHNTIGSDNVYMRALGDWRAHPIGQRPGNGRRKATAEIEWLLTKLQSLW
jgi:hypothetical protein